MLRRNLFAVVMVILASMQMPNVSGMESVKRFFSSFVREKRQREVPPMPAHRDPFSSDSDDEGPKAPPSPKEPKRLSYDEAAYNALLAGERNMIGKNLCGADLSGTTLTHVDFTGATLTDTKFCGATLNSVKFERSTLFGTNFSGATFNKSCFSNCLIYECNFNNATFHRSTLQQSTIIHSMLQETIFKTTTLDSCYIIGTCCTQAQFTCNTQLNKICFVCDNLNNAIFECCTISDSQFSGFSTLPHDIITHVVQFYGALFNISHDLLTSIKSCTPEALAQLETAEKDFCDNSTESAITLHDATFKEVTIKQSAFFDATFAASTFSTISIESSRFNNVTFIDQERVERASLSNITFTQSAITNSNLNKVILRNANFFECYLQNISLQSLQAINLTIIQTVLSKLDFTSAELTHMYIKDQPSTTNEVPQEIRTKYKLTQQTMTKTAMGEKLNFTKAKLCECCFIGTVAEGGLKEMVDASIQEKKPWYGSPAIDFLDKICNAKIKASMFNCLYASALLPECIFTEAQLINSYIGNIMLIHCTGLDKVRHIHHSSFKNCLISPSDKYEIDEATSNILRRKGAMVNTICAKEYEDFWQKEPEDNLLANLLQFAASQTIGRGVDAVAGIFGQSTQRHS